MNTMSSIVSSPLRNIEHRLRNLLPADLYVEAWVEPSAESLTRVFEHLRTLQHVLYNYMPRHVTVSLPSPGVLSHAWQEGTLMFTDLAGFTPLMEANAKIGQQGAEALLNLLNAYFATMLEIISKSGGNLLEFTGDALLIQFPSGQRQTDTLRAVRAGLRMQHAMERFSQIDTPQGVLSLGMRVGIHTGRFLMADIGTPYRMEHILMGEAVQRTKRAEGAGEIGRVCLTEEAFERVEGSFYFNYGKENHLLVIDELSDEELGSYEITISGGRRPSSAVLTDRSVDGLTVAIEELLNTVEALACFIPDAVLDLLVESASRRHIVPQFASPTILFVNLAGIPQSADRTEPGEEEILVTTFSRAFSLINAAVESHGGVLKKVTYHLYGSDIMIMFGIPSAHTNDPSRAASAALAIRDIISNIPSLEIGGEMIDVYCQIGLAMGPVFAAEIGDPRGRREFNVLGDTVNTAARLMALAKGNQILLTEEVFAKINHDFDCEDLGMIKLKGKADETSLLALTKLREGVVLY